MKRTFLTALVLVGVLIPMTFVPAQRNDTPEMAVQQRPPVTIQIVTIDGTVTTSPYSIAVKQKQRVEWTSSLGDWEVTFHSDDPFGPGPDNRTIKGKMGQTHGRPIQSLAKLGPYQYDVTVTLPDGTVLTEDPEIVVEADGEKR